MVRILAQRRPTRSRGSSWRDGGVRSAAPEGRGRADRCHAGRGPVGGVCGPERPCLDDGGSAASRRGGSTAGVPDDQVLELEAGQGRHPHALRPVLHVIPRRSRSSTGGSPESTTIPTRLVILRDSLATNRGRGRTWHSRRGGRRLRHGCNLAPVPGDMDSEFPGSGTRSRSCATGCPMRLRLARGRGRTGAWWSRDQSGRGRPPSRPSAGAAGRRASSGRMRLPPCP